MTFADELLAHIGGVDDATDIRAAVASCYFYDFDGYPVRLWDGHGLLITSTGVGGAVETPTGTLSANEWIGTFDEDGNNLHQTAAVSDNRDGTSPRYEFGLPHIDAATYAALQADQGLAKGRDLTCYNIIVLPGEGMRPNTPMRFAWRMTMRSVTFSERWEGEPGNAVKVYGAKVLAMSGEVGRSLAPRGTYTDTSIRERSRQLGVASDSGGSMIAGNASRTYRVGG